MMRAAKFFAKLTGQVCIVAVALVLMYCSGKRNQDLAEWEQLENFRVVMERAFVPLRDSSSVASVEKNIEQIAEAGEKLAGGDVPEKVNNAAMRAKLEKLKSDTRSLAREIADGTEDDVIGTEFYAVHDLFLEIDAAWRR